MYADLGSKTVVVTGAARGLGQRIAQRFCEAGSEVAIVARGDVDWLVDDYAKKIEVIRCDIREPQPIADWLAARAAAARPATTLINNAGVIDEQPLLDVSQESVTGTFAVNVFATFALCQMFARHFEPHGYGSIVNAASYAATLPSVNSGAYGASKAALVSLTSSMAAEWAPLGVRVNAFSPGVVRTPMTEPKLAQHEAEMLKAISANRLGTPDEIANVVLFLASDVSSYITGANIDVSGGKLVVQNPHAAW